MSAIAMTSRSSTIMPKKERNCELDALPMASAKPSAIRAAAAGARLAAKAERERLKLEQEKATERERRAREQQLKMQRYRDEIARIKKAQEEEEERERRKELERKAKNEAASSEERQLPKRRLPTQLTREMSSRVLDQEISGKREKSVLGYTTDDYSTDDDYELDEDVEEAECSGPAVTTELKQVTSVRSEAKDRGKRMVDEMEQNFAQVVSLGDTDESTQPEDESQEQDESQEHVPVSIAAMTLTSGPPRQREYRVDRNGRLRKEPKRNFSTDENGVVSTDDQGFVRKAPSRNPSNHVPEMRRRAMQRDLLYDDQNAQVDENEPKRFSKFHRKSSSGAGGDANMKKLSQKQEEEKLRLKEQKQKLDEAEENFRKGHNLCWKLQDSAGALGEYRKALFTRESLLGKYHEQTGRSYFWIGKSLAKLREFSEALVAFSRALRIFERVVRKEHKYHKWAVHAIISCVEGLDDSDLDYRTYMSTLEASIKLESEGDAHRRKGERAAAVAKYRDAIDNVEEYHPDAADLYCKIALILRQDGDFDRALEEYRFASEIYELSLGADHPETVKALNQVMEKKRLGQLSNLLMEKLNLSKC